MASRSGADGCTSTSSLSCKSANEKTAPGIDEDIGSFTCSVCGLTEKYSYFGASPPYAKHTILMEDGYIIRDPFSPFSSRSFLQLGSKCSFCREDVCLSQECSLFYTKRICITCALEHVAELPVEIQEELRKKKKKKS